MTFTSIPPKSRKPYAVMRAVQILWCWVVYLALSGLYQGWVDTARLTAIIPPEAVVIPNSILLLLTAGGNFLMALTMIGVVIQTNRGKNWARILLLLSFIVDLGATIFSRPDNLIGYVLAVINLGLQLYALWLLFTKPGSLWFRQAVTHA